MKNLIQNIPVKIRLMGLFSAVCLVLAGIILICENQIIKGLYDQQMARRWSKEGEAAQVSVFFAEDAVENENYFLGIGQSVDKALQNAAITKEKEQARLWISAVSRMGKVTLSTQRAKVELQAVGVRGEFFQFHSQKIVKGAMFSEDNLMKDGIIIDRETAWQLFGSSDVAGMQVMIGQVPHYISGVIERGNSRLEEAAGLEKPICFLSLESLNQYGTAKGGFTYEIVLPNPVKGFGFSTMQTVIGNENENVVMVENSTRFQFLSLVRVLKDFGIRSMSFKGVVYPYWENIARGKEDVLALLLLLKMMLLVLPVIFIVTLIVYLWKNRTWNMGQAVAWGKDKLYEADSKRVQKKKKRKESAHRTVKTEGKKEENREKGKIN